MKFWEFEKFCQKKNLKIFTINDLKMMFNEYSSEYLRLKISRWKKKGYLRNLKKGIYIFTDMDIDEFEIASALIIPSYISLESALSHYSIILDIASTVTSITTKNTRLFQIDKIKYQYYHIKKELFEHFYHLRENIFIAEPEKAIVDYFYFRKPAKGSMFYERLNAVVIKSLDVPKLKKISSKYPSYVQNLTNTFVNVITG